MTKPVPPRIESPKAFIAVGAREFFILGVAAVLVLLVLIVKLGFVPKVGIAVLIVGTGLAAAFGRDRRTGKTIEQYLFNLVRYYSRARFRQRGAMPPAQEKQEIPEPLGRKAEEEPIEAGTPAAPSKIALPVRPLPLGPGLLFAVLSFSFLSMLLAWIWLGGMAEVQLWVARSRF